MSKYNRLEGDSIKEIKFYGLGYDNICQAEVSIYDNNILIYNGITYNNILKVCLEENKSYKIVATSCGETIMKCIYINEQSKYFIIFNRSIFKPNRLITFTLTDYFYNLPIERGNLILWQR